MAGRPRKIENLFTPTTKDNVQFSEGQKSKGILDDYAIRLNADLKGGTVQNTPTADKHIVNKKFVDDEITDLTTTYLDDHPHQDVTTTATPTWAGATIDGMNISNDGVKTTFLGTVGDYNRIGNDGTTSVGMSSEDDLMVTGKFETKGTSRFTNELAVKYAIPQLTVDSSDSSKAMISLKANGGTGFRFYAVFDKEQSLMVTRDTVGRQIILTDYASRERDFGHAPQTNPTYYIQSATDPNVNNTQWMSLTHDQTDGVLDAGSGVIKISDPQCVGDYHSNDGTAGFTGTGAYTNFTIKNGIITGAT